MIFLSGVASTHLLAMLSDCGEQPTPHAAALLPPPKFHYRLTRIRSASWRCAAITYGTVAYGTVRKTQ